MPFGTLLNFNLDTLSNQSLSRLVSAQNLMSLVQYYLSVALSMAHHLLLLIRHTRFSIIETNNPYQLLSSNVMRESSVRVENICNLSRPLFLVTRGNLFPFSSYGAGSGIELTNVNHREFVFFN
jgi:hypothetical protein